VLTVILCAAIALIFNALAPPPPAPVEGEDTGTATSADTSEGQRAEEGPETTQTAEVDGVVEEAPESETQPPTSRVDVVHHRLENGLLALELTNEAPNRGGIVSGFELLSEKFQGHETATNALLLGGQRTLEVSFADEVTDFRLPRDASFEVSNVDSRHMSLVHRSDVVEVEERFELLDGYEARLVVTVRNRSASDQTHRMHVRTRIGEPEEKSRWDIHRGLCRMPEGLEDETLSDVEEGPARFTGKVIWGGVDSKYFGTFVVPAEPFAACEIRASEDGAYLMGTLSTAPATLGPGEARTYDLGLYMGVKQLEYLEVFSAGRSEPLNLGEAINWGWFGSLSEVLGRVLLSLLRWFYDITGVWGVAILLLTVVVKLVTLPLTLKQISSMKRMKEIQPEIKKIKEKYGDDKVKQGQEMQALFARSGVNPLAGCLPMLVQFPIWIALYSMLSTAVDLVHEPFLWLPDLTKQDPYYITPVGLGILMVLQQRITPQATMDPAQAKMMMWVMPTMFTFFMLFLPSGLAVYIFTNILLSLIQTIIQVGSTKKGEEPAS